MLLDSLGSCRIEEVSPDLFELQDSEDLVEDAVVLIDHGRVAVSHLPDETERDRHRVTGRRPRARN